MASRYFEVRGHAHTLSVTSISDAMRHLHARQHLGKAIIVCSDPRALLAQAHKQWLKLSRELQQRRTATNDTNEILRYTYAITHMQHMVFAAAPPHQQPDADVYFVKPGEAELMPPNCHTLYLLQVMPANSIHDLIGQLPSASLVVDYFGQLHDSDFGLAPKLQLEDQVRSSWQSVRAFLKTHKVEITNLSDQIPSTLDDAVDTLLDNDREFLRLAADFQHSLNLARPLLTITKAEREQYNTLGFLAQQIRTFSLGISPEDVIKYHTDDMFFMHDHDGLIESLADAIVRHQAAGRFNLARALMA
jgi:hypothetical protein